MASSSWAGVMLIYEISSDDGKVVIEKKATSKPTAAEVHSIDFTADEKRALSNSSNGILLWDATTWLTFKIMADSLGCLSPDGNQIAVVRNSAASDIEIWAVGDLEKVMAIPRIYGK